ncbi:DNA single-strand annealing protein RecT-like protein [Paraburkholderia atlantica]|uniref:DNA single-strand annealing protein RecT-like protein n=1 Tax=Paraburkholderia atlantica TaxID=2654982 RepID=D5WMB3_PARAM|nr:RecT family recombinase [Paraburkholderia atlantica]ADG20359.1 DNA single-strand annealing protein RecT-like protein [Paraburkholderia atlantica]
MNSNVMPLGAERGPLAPSQTSGNSLDMVLDVATIQAINTIAETMAGGKVAIPVHLRGNKADCFAVAMQAFQWRMNPFAVAQKTHISQGGQLGYEAQLVNAVVSNLAPITGRPDYQFLGDWNKVLGKVEERKSDKGGKYYVATYTKGDEQGLGVIVRATLRGESEPREVTVMMSQAYPRFSTQWATDPQQQICYLAIRKWARRFTPDVLLGVYTPDELSAERPETIDMGRADEVRAAATTQAPSKTDSLRSRMASKRTGATAADTPNADAMIRAIENATTGHELKVAIARIDEITNDVDRERVRTAYQEKVRTEKERGQRETAAQADQAQQQDNGAPPLAPYETMLSRIQQCNDVEVLAVLADEARAYPETERIKLDQAYQDRREILLGA